MHATIIWGHFNYFIREEIKSTNSISKIKLTLVWWCHMAWKLFVSIGSGNSLMHVWCRAITSITSFTGLLSIGQNSRNKPQWNFDQNIKIFFKENAFQNDVCKLSAILFQPKSASRCWLVVWHQLHCFWYRILLLWLLHPSWTKAITQCCPQASAPGDITDYCRVTLWLLSQ